MPAYSTKTEWPQGSIFAFSLGRTSGKEGRGIPAGPITVLLWNGYFLRGLDESPSNSTLLVGWRGYRYATDGKPPLSWMTRYGEKIYSILPPPPSARYLKNISECWSDSYEDLWKEYQNQIGSSRNVRLDLLMEG